MLRRLFKIIGWTILSILVLVIVAVAVMVWYLTPAKLTPLVENVANEYIDGRLELSRVELTFWSSFPHVEVEVDSLCLTSGSLALAPDSVRDRLPSCADSLLSVGHMRGGVNLLSLLRGRIDLYDLRIDRLRANIVIADDSLNNFSIMRPSGDTETATDQTPATLPPLSIDRFVLTDAGPVTFTSLPDSLSLSATLSNVSLTDGGAATYSLVIDGGASTDILDDFNFTPLTLGLDGRVGWNPGRPAAVDVRDLDISVNDLSARLSTRVDATDCLTVESFDLSVADLDINNIVRHLPPDLSAGFAGLDTDLSLTSRLTLTRPYILADSLTVPSFDASVDITPCRVYMDNLRMDHVELSASAHVDGDSLDLSTLDIQKLKLRGHAMDLDVAGTVTGPIDNPGIDGRLAAALRFNRLPRVLLRTLPVNIAGRLDARTSVRMHLGDLSAAGFHNIRLDGEATLSGLDMMTRDSLLTASAGRAKLKFGTSRSLEVSDRRVDSMLTVSIDIDTASIMLPGLNVRGSHLLAGLGTLNRASSVDTARINPFGGLIRFKSLFLEQPDDSMTVRLRDVETNARLNRYRGTDRAPQLHFDLRARRIGTRMPDFSISISQPELAVNAHLETRASASRRDSTRRRGVSASGGRVSRVDSVQRPDDVIDWNVSNDLKTLLRRWDVDGRLKSNRAFIFMRSFPLRQRASDIDLQFNTDTVRLNSLKYSIGNTRLGVRGDITNIERALAGRSGRSKLRIDFEIDAPYIDINELATTTFHESSGNAGPDPDYDEDISYDRIEANDTAPMRPVLVPGNIDARLALRADTILYSDLLMHRLGGEILVNNNAVNLHRLHASTDIGEASLSALYWAPDTSDMRFGMGLKLDRFHVERVLSLIPAVDSLLPALQGFSGVINANLAATANITPAMDIDLPTFKGALKLDGDSLVLLDADTFKMLAKWLVFKNKKRNMIDSMSVEIVVDNSQVEIYPFIFDIDRYRLGVMGHNDLDMNLDYHVSVLKSPLPFKFGINIKGNIDNYKIRLGGAKVKPGTVARYAIADSTRINLLGQIEDVFRRGSMSSDMKGLRTRAVAVRETDLSPDTISAADSLLMQREGFLPAPDTTAVATPQPQTKKRKNGRNK